MNRIGDTLQHTGSNEDLIKAFVSFDVDFILIGGLAIAWYCSNRQADDMDLLINSTQENSEKICKALTSLKLSGFDNESFIKSGLQVPLKQHLYAELLTTKAGDPPYSEVLASSISAKLFNIPIKLASVESLLKMKQQAALSAESQREKHEKDIELLKSHAV